MKMKTQRIQLRYANVQRQLKAFASCSNKFVVPSYARFDLVLERGEGSYVWDVNGRRYLDLGGGIAVCALGHANPEITDALARAIAETHSRFESLLHRSRRRGWPNELSISSRRGACFFCNSGAEANEGLFKLARKFGHDEGRYEIITAVDSFHGRTLAGIAATGQEKVKKGFEPMVPGFKQVPFNDLEAMRAAITKSTAAILVEPIQGESGITIATPEYLLGLRKLCDEQNLLLLLRRSAGRTFSHGEISSWQRILEDPEIDFLPDGISMAKALGGGFPIGAFWVREKFADVLSAGTHASTFGGTPLACAVALRILDVIERDDLAANARRIGEFLLSRLRDLQSEISRSFARRSRIGINDGNRVRSEVSQRVEICEAIA